MRFLSLLKSGVSVKNVALDFVIALLKKSWQENELSLELACDFVNDIITAIGIECAITPEQINAGGNYVWPIQQIQIYNFHYIEIEFKKLEEFLKELIPLVQLQQDIFVNDLRHLHNDEFESPVDYLMQLLAVWCNFYRKLQKQEEFSANKRFEEPLSRINIHLLTGMHEIRKIYRSEFHLLDVICNRLYWSALQGLYYQQTHELIFSSLLNIFFEDFDLFYACSSQTINFFYEAFAVEINASTPFKLYQSLKNMLLDLDTPYKTNILINFLIEPYMQKVYYTTFLAQKYKWYGKTTTKNIESIQQEALKFLNVLQSKLLTLDCFSREFLESILNLIFKTEPLTSNLACNLYITMMKRKFSEQMILRHIMDFYAVRMGSVTHLKSYIQALYQSFDSLLNFNNLLEIITDNSSADIIRMLSAHILVIVFKLKVQEKDSSTQQELQHLLQILPEIFENLYCQKTEGILLKVYSFMPLGKIRKNILDNFIHYAVGIFTYIDSPLEYPLLMNIFNVFHKFLIYNREWQHLEIISDHLINKYKEMVKTLKEMEQKQKKLPPKKSFDYFNNLLKRFNIILKTKYDLLDNNYLEIIRNLSQYFLYNVEIKTFIAQHKSLMDLYVLEILISCFLKLVKEENDINQRHKFLPEAQALYKYLWLEVKTFETLMTFPIVRIKTYFCSILRLLIHLPLKLDSNVYHHLVQILVGVLFDNKLSIKKDANELQQIHPLQSMDYKRLMLKQFTGMHKHQRVLINTNAVWKLCIYYGKPKHKFQEELKDLLITLARYRIQIYKHIISVLIYNLYKQTPALKHMTIMSILKEHKHLIDNVIEVESSQLLKIHVVLSVLQILEKALSVQRIKKGYNRLEALRHLNIFIEDLNLNQLQAKSLMLEQLQKLRQHLISAEECKILLDFSKLI